ncbi:MAG: hypothetical protein QY326_05265 [Bdellovibrionota bacterium]|nr:MAG: hypothetical protein QY326_05265 [Bdellovibrionota bacterium]
MATITTCTLVASVALSSATFSQTTDGSPAPQDRSLAGYHVAGEPLIRQTESGLAFGSLPAGFLLEFNMPELAQPIRRVLTQSEAQRLSMRTWEVGVIGHPEAGDQVGELVLFEVASGEPLSLGLYDLHTANPYAAIGLGAQARPQSELPLAGSIGLTLLAAIALGSWWLRKNSGTDNASS